MKKMNIALVVLSLFATPAFAINTVSVSGTDAQALTQILELSGAAKESHLDEFSLEVRNVRVSVDSRSGIGPFHAPIFTSSLHLPAEQCGDLYNLLGKYVMSIGTPGNRTISVEAIACNAGPDVIPTCEITTN